tara:strand:+ start:196 stop:369 length:174 start_codon:yes stop_codon:yes gene_type:complete
MKSEQTIKKGRPVGRNTTAKVKVKDLYKYFSETAEIPVAIAFLDAVGIKYESKGSNS